MPIGNRLSIKDIIQETCSSRTTKNTICQLYASGSRRLRPIYSPSAGRRSPEFGLTRRDPGQAFFEKTEKTFFRKKKRFFRKNGFLEKTLPRKTITSMRTIRYSQERRFVILEKTILRFQQGRFVIIGRNQTVNCFSW